nr:MAG TPA: hypothetical protein [Caudoviricetes sp.]
MFVIVAGQRLIAQRIRRAFFIPFQVYLFPTFMSLAKSTYDIGGCLSQLLYLLRQ